MEESTATTRAPQERMSEMKTENDEKVLGSVLNNPQDQQTQGGAEMNTEKSTESQGGGPTGTLTAAPSSSGSDPRPEGTVPQWSSAPQEIRPTTDRPCHKLSVNLINTYKYINKVYYEAKARRLRQQTETKRNGVNNNGYDDQNYDYIVRGDEIFAERYILKQVIGKGSFGQVVCAYDQTANTEVAIKIIKSRRPFRQQAQTEIDLLQRLRDNSSDSIDDWNVVRLIDNFEFRNHVCLVFEMLSCNLYELLKNTRFRGVSLNLIRKFSTQIVRALIFLDPQHMDIIHCDLKPENILLRHHRRSAIKIIDFGSSCLSNRRQYTYIQSRFYRSPEVILGLQYDQKIDIWSLGCVLVEMHTGEPLFGGTDPLDQICKIVDVLGMPPASMLERSPEKVRQQFFNRIENVQPPHSMDVVAQESSPECDPTAVCFSEDGGTAFVLRRFGKSPSAAGGAAKPQRDRDATANPRSLADILGVHTGGPQGRRKDEAGHSVERYEEFLDYIRGLLQFEPAERHSAGAASEHAFNSKRDQHTGGGSGSGRGHGRRSTASADPPPPHPTAPSSASVASAPDNPSVNQHLHESGTVPFTLAPTFASTAAADLQISTDAPPDAAMDVDDAAAEERGRLPAGPDPSTEGPHPHPHRSPRLRSLSAPSSASGDLTSSGGGRRYRTRGAAATEAAGISDGETATAGLGGRASTAGQNGMKGGGAHQDGDTAGVVVGTPAAHLSTADDGVSMVSPQVDRTNSTNSTTLASETEATEGDMNGNGNGTTRPPGAGTVIVSKVAGIGGGGAGVKAEANISVSGRVLDDTGSDSDMEMDSVPGVEG